MPMPFGPRRAVARREGSGATANLVLGESCRELIPASQTLGEALKEDRSKEKKHDEKLMWFHGSINRKLAESRLKKGGHKPGYFLVRESRAYPGDFTLSLLDGSGKPDHFHIKQIGQGAYTIDEGPVLHGLDEVIRYYSAEAQGLPTKLSVPCKESLPPRLSRTFGYTNLLHKAVSTVNTDLASKVLEHKHCPDINAKNEKGSTALHLACELGLTELVEKILLKSASVTVTNYDGFTPLQLAARVNQPGIIRRLVVNGRADTQDLHRDTGKVALHEAAEAGHLECVRMLLSLGAPAWPLDHSGAPPHKLAKFQGHDACAELIDNYEVAPAQTSRSEWLHEKIDREGATTLLLKKVQDGTFLIRKSKSRKGNYVLSMVFDLKVYNYSINKIAQNAYQIDDGPLLTSLEHLVECYCWRAGGLPCKLTHALAKDGEPKPMSVRHIIDLTMMGLGPEESKLQEAECKSLTMDYANIGGDYMEAEMKVIPNRKKPRRNYSIMVPKEPLQLDPKTIHLEHEIGQGEFGSVLKGTWTSIGGEKIGVAIKTLHEQSTGAAKDQFLQEAKVMVKLDHPCIVKLIGVCEGPPIMLVQELASMGSLLDFLLDYPEKVKRETDLCLWAAQIACGMNYLESKCFVHRDLAARNILLANKQEARVGDFGLSRATGRDSHYQASAGGKWPLRWYAPEAFLYGTFSSSSDVWSYGITLWEMFSFGEQPYGEKTGAEVTEYIRKGGRLKCPNGCQDDVFRLMQECWAFEPKDRPTFNFLHEHFKDDPLYAHFQPLVLDSSC